MEENKEILWDECKRCSYDFNDDCGEGCRIMLSYEEENEDSMDDDEN